MRFGRTSLPSIAGSLHGRRRAGFASRRGFTLTETLAALLFLAIVIPVAVRGIQLATYAGTVSQRKLVAVRIGESILAESLAATSGSALGSSGSIIEGGITFRWEVRSESWTDATLRLYTTEVFFDVQGREHDVRLSTLATAGSL